MTAPNDESRDLWKSVNGLREKSERDHREITEQIQEGFEKVYEKTDVIKQTQAAQAIKINDVEHKAVDAMKEIEDHKTLHCRSRAERIGFWMLVIGAFLSSVFGLAFTLIQMGMGKKA